jgi:hypothetical protein
MLRDIVFSMFKFKKNLLVVMFLMKIFQLFIIMDKLSESLQSATFPSFFAQDLVPKVFSPPKYSRFNHCLKSNPKYFHFHVCSSLTPLIEPLS